MNPNNVGALTIKALCSEDRAQVKADLLCLSKENPAHYYLYIFLGNSE
jgi:hypothetical protein